MLSPADLARLQMLEGARDKLITGTAIAEVEYAGERRSYARADMNVLLQEIASLKRQYGTVRVRM